MTTVNLIMIGYHCNHLDGQLNYQTSTHWIISAIAHICLFKYQNTDLLAVKVFDHTSDSIA